ncbi:MAG: retroviral-like aspartic protease family protein, partial [Kangiellaceae bacterium]|nr:retroviral-like aspartic protease family protein [Kangiellaceae bacterium]
KLMSLTRKTDVKVSGLFSKNMSFVMFDELGGVDVIIGMDYLTVPVIQLDYLNKKMRFATPNVFRFSEKAAIPMKQKGQSYYVETSLDDVKIEMLLDTGNASKLAVPLDKLKGTAIESLLTDENQKFLKQSGLHKRKLKYHELVSNNFRIGPHVLENVVFHVISEETEMSKNRAVLGYDILKNFLVTIDIQNRNLYLSI